VLKQIELYLDGELVGFEHVEIERHLGGCSPCMGHAEFQRKLKDMLKDKCGCHDVPPELVDRVRAMFDRPHPHT
jgi:mycothiol system anti-sigma-R factor